MIWCGDQYVECCENDVRVADSVRQVFRDVTVCRLVIGSSVLKALPSTMSATTRPVPTVSHPGRFDLPAAL